VPLFPTESPTKIIDETYTSRSARLSDPLLPTDIPSVISVGNYRRIKTKGGIFENFGAHFNLFPVGITDGNKCHRQHLMLSSLFLLLPVFSLSFGRDLIVLVIVFNILKGM
jgi:hypothetical protein